MAQFCGMPRTFYVYILANRSRTLCVGVTNDIHRRVLQHREGKASDFTRRYMVRRLVHVEVTTDVRAAITREKEIKAWLRTKKIALIEANNPEWEDLAATWFETPLYREGEDPSPDGSG